MGTSDTAVEDVIRPMRKDAARNRVLLIAAARVVFAKRGLDASLDDIARQAGVGVGTAYRHFSNKFELAEAIMQETVDAVLDAASRALEADDAWAGLVDFLESTMELQARDRALREILLGVHVPKTESARVGLDSQVARLLIRAQEAGEVRTDAQTTDLGAALIMLCHVADLGGDVAPDLWRRYLPTLLSGLRPGGPPLPSRALTGYELHDALVWQHRTPAARSGE